MFGKTIIPHKNFFVNKPLNYCLAAKAPQPNGQRSACGANKAVVAISRSLNENSFALGVINYCLAPRRRGLFISCHATRNEPKKRTRGGVALERPLLTPLCATQAYAPSF